MPSIGRLRYLESAPRPGVRPRGALVLLHAFPLGARMWEPQLALSDDGWRVIAPQLRGFDGGTGEPPAASIDDYAGDVVDLLDQLHIEEAVVGGLSMGGYVAFAVLRHAARYVRALILADTRSEPDTPEGVEGRQRMLRLLDANGVAGVADEMIPKLVGLTTLRERPEVVEQVRSLILANGTAAVAGALRAMMTRPDSTPLLPSIHVPALVIVGAEDAVTPLAAAEAMHRAIAGSELALIPSAGHLSNLEQPRLFHDALARFVSHRV